MIDFNLYAQLSITAGVAKKFKQSSKSKHQWRTLLKKHTDLKSQLAMAIRKKLSRDEFFQALGKGTVKTSAVIQARKLLNYDPSGFTSLPYITREAFVHAVYCAHHNEKKAGAKLALWFKQI